MAFRRVGSDMKQTAPERNRHRMRPVIGSQLTHQVLDMETDGSLRDYELIGNLFVAIPVSNQLEYLQFASRKIFLAQVLG